MRRTITTLVVGVLLLSLLTAAQAQQSEIDKLRETVKQLGEQLKAVTEKLQQMEAKQAAQPTPPPAPPKASWTDKLSISGYWQSRYEARQNTRDEFIMRRMYLNFVGKWNERTNTVLTLSRIPANNDPNIEFEAAQVNYRFADDWSVTFGQAFNSFGWDTWESSSKRLVFDRWAAGEGVASRPGRAGIRGLWYAGAVDRGVWVTRHARGSEPTVIVGVSNGNYNKGDNDDNKVVSLDLKCKRPNGMQYGASFLTGDYTVDAVAPALPVTQTRQALGLYFHTDPKPWGFQAEWLDGKMFGADVDGWYGQVAYNTGGKGTPYVRYEQFDQNKDATGDTYMSLRAGYAYQLDKNNEFTLELQDAKSGSLGYDQAGVQWQLGF